MELKLEALYQVSPSMYFQQLEQTLDALARRVERAEEAMATVQGNILPMLKSSQPAGAPPVDNWYYDARMPNYYFDNVYDPEVNEAYFKRWVGPQPAMTWRLPLDRRYQYVMEVDIVDFHQPEYREALFVRVDGDLHPWLGIKGKRFQTLLSPHKCTEGPVLLELGIAAGAGAPDSKTAFFSFARIEIMRRICPAVTAEDTDAAGANDCAKTATAPRKKDDKPGEQQDHAAAPPPAAPSRSRRAS